MGNEKPFERGERRAGGADGVEPLGRFAEASEDVGLAYNDRGLIPCIVQDATSGEVLMMAWMNEEALRLTLEQRTMWFFSRSREELWHKGDTSGNVQQLVELCYDCDADTLLARVNAAGPACHTGARSCFFRTLG